MDQGKRLFINSISSVLTFLIQLGIGFLLVPYILHHLTKEVYGIWALTGSFFAYSNLLTLGLNSAVNRYIPIYLVNRDWNSMNRVVSTTLFYYSMCGIIILIGTFFITINFADWFKIPENYKTASMWVVSITGLSFAALVPFSVFSAVLTGLQRYDLQSVSTILSRLVRIVGIIILFSNGFGIIALSIISAAAKLLNDLMIVIFSIKGCREMKFRRNFVSWSRFREMFSYSVNSFLYAAGSLIQLQAGKLVIGLMIGASFVTEYEMASVLLLQLTALVMAGSTVMKPAASSLDAQKKHEQVKKMFLYGIKYAFMIVIPATIFILIYGKAIMNIWLGESPFLETSIQVLMILIVPEMFRLGYVGAYFVVVGLGRHKVFGISALATGVFSVILSYIFESLLHLGVISVAIGFAIPNLITSALIIPLYCAKVIELRYFYMLYKSLYPAVLASIPFCIYSLLARNFFWPTTVTHLLSLLGIGLIILFISWWIKGFDGEEKTRFLSYILFKKDTVDSSPKD
jgi:O-antigen/teichoic acid export membrane protein